MAKFEKNDKFKKVDDFDKSLVLVRRVTKVVKGGRNLSFSALVVAGDRKGKVGVGSGKAAETSVAIEKAFQSAKKNLVNAPIVKNNTIPHEIEGNFSTSKVLLFPAKEGTGLIAGGAVRSVLELAGYKDVVSKSRGGRNKINTVKATLEGLKALRTKEQIATLRGKTVEEI